MHGGKWQIPTFIFWALYDFVILTLYEVIIVGETGETRRVQNKKN